MEIDEVAARVMRSYWALLLVMTVVPLVLVGLVMSGQEPPAVAKSRLQASSRATDAAPGDAGVSIVVSQVKAFATTENLLREVLRNQRVDRSTTKTAKAIEVTGLGTSTIVELSVKDPDPDVARRLADAIGAAVVREINDSNQGSIQRQMDGIDKRIRELERRLGPLSRRANAQPNPDIDAMNERERVQAELTDLRANRSDLQTQLSTAGTASVVQPAVLAPRSNPVVMMASIAGLVGLIGGILIAVVTEMARPTIPGQRRVARRLGVPLLGWADRGPGGLADLGRRIRLAARKEGVGRVALVGAPGPLPPDLVSAVASAVYGDDTKLVTARAGDDDEPGGGSGTTRGDGGEPSSNSSGPGGGKSTSVVRAGGGTAVMAKKSAQVSPSEITQPVPVRRLCHVHAFEDIDPGSDEEVGVIVLVGPVTRVAGLETVRDLVAASGWPLLGVVGATRKIPSRRSRG
ncbi:Capsular polysaccharide biosynthesis protein [Actinomadura meyerae]|uniref:Capsular polysaccharide biosynthesis protein n=1 Tax=Actinomadura meyerae TaxID=240840 RepID=A0A239HZI0_9ACTN|nr:Capsular polysaccharide biosynthesis protein [Actinomadura meyerae]